MLENDALDPHIPSETMTEGDFVLSMAEDERVMSANLPSYLDKVMRTTNGDENLYRIRNGLKGAKRFVLPSRIVNCSYKERRHHFEIPTNEFSVPKPQESQGNALQTALVNAPIPKEAMVYYMEFTQWDTTNLNFFFGLTGIKKSDHAPWVQSTADGSTAYRTDLNKKIQERLIRRIELESMEYSKSNDAPSCSEHFVNERRNGPKKQLARTEIREENGVRKISFSSESSEQNYCHRIPNEDTVDSGIYEEELDLNLDNELFNSIRNPESGKTDRYGYTKHRNLSLDTADAELEDLEDIKENDTEYIAIVDARRNLISAEYGRDINKALSRKYHLDSLKGMSGANRTCESISEMCFLETQDGGYRQSLFELDGEEVASNVFESTDRESDKADETLMMDEEVTRSMNGYSLQVPHFQEECKDSTDIHSNEQYDIAYLDGLIDFVDPQYLTVEEYDHARYLNSVVENHNEENSLSMARPLQQDFDFSKKHLPSIKYYWRQRKYGIEQVAFDDSERAQNPSFYFQPRLGTLGNNHFHHRKKTVIDYPVFNFGILLDRYTQEVKFTINGMLLESTCKLNEYADSSTIGLFPFVSAYEGQFVANFGYGNRGQFLFDVDSYATICRRKYGPPLFDGTKFESLTSINEKASPGPTEELSRCSWANDLMDQYLALWGSTWCSEKETESPESQKLTSIFRNYKDSGDLSKCADDCEGTVLEENKKLMAALAYAQLMEVVVGRAQCSDKFKLAGRVYEHSASLPPEIVANSIEMLLSGRALSEEDKKLYHPDFYNYVRETLRSDIATALKFNILKRLHQIAPQEAKEQFGIPIPMSMQIDNDLLTKILSIHTADVDKPI